ncbi:MAG: hypothetical protein SFY80_05675 [Verrucomicrobiota bacterium]|nr:hypothetical protein [Verrucomicrobiota bacterium]
MFITLRSLSLLTVFTSVSTLLVLGSTNRLTSSPEQSNSASIVPRNNLVQWRTVETWNNVYRPPTRLEHPGTGRIVYLHDEQYTRYEAGWLVGNDAYALTTVIAELPSGQVARNVVLNQKPAFVATAADTWTSLFFYLYPTPPWQPEGGPLEYSQIRFIPDHAWPIIYLKNTEATPTLFAALETPNGEDWSLRDASMSEATASYPMIATRGSLYFKAEMAAPNGTVLSGSNDGENWFILSSLEDETPVSLFSTNDGCQLVTRHHNDHALKIRIFAESDMLQCDSDALLHGGHWELETLYDDNWQLLPVTPDVSQILPFVTTTNYAYNAVLGRCYVAFFPWIHSEDVGYVAAFPDFSNEKEAFFFWHPSQEWLYTREDWFPFLWSFTHRNWIWIDSGQGRTHQWYLYDGTEWSYLAHP